MIDEDAIRRICHEVHGFSRRAEWRFTGRTERKPIMTVLQIILAAELAIAILGFGGAWVTRRLPSYQSANMDDQIPTLIGSLGIVLLIPTLIGAVVWRAVFG